jgi:branched-subunit amino acid ABC-type transport system permease component
MAPSRRGCCAIPLIGCADSRHMNVDMFVMQAFTGLSIFTILMLMALGLAIVFGLMGVINMAHGELMAMGAYCTYATARTAPTPRRCSSSVICPI